MSLYGIHSGKKNIVTFKLSQPPKKKRQKWSEAIIKCKYSHKKNISNIPLLYSVAYPATTSDSVSEWSKGARLDSKNNTTTKLDAAGAYKKKYQ